MALKPQLSEKCFVIEKNKKVWLANSFAKKLGVINGVKIGEAKKMNPSLLIEKYRADQYRLFFQQFKKIIKTQCKNLRFISPYTVYADASVTPVAENLFAEHLHSLLYKELEMDIRIGGGPTESIAFAASELTTMGEQIMYISSAHAQIFQQLPITCLQGIGKRTALLLSGLGITTIKQFATSHISFIKSLFGEKGELLFHIANTMRPPNSHADMQKNAQQMTIPI